MMAVPTIANVLPLIVRTGGRQLIKIRGSNFQLTPPPPLTGPAPVPNPPVQVIFHDSSGADIQAREVRVLTPTLLHVLTPIANPGPATVTVVNVDQDGVPIMGESATLTGFAFARPAIGSADPAQQSNLTRLIAALVLEMRRQIFDNVVIATSTDFDDTPDGANIAALATLPGLVLSGPVLRLSRFYTDRATREVVDQDGDTYQQRPARTVDLVFTLIGVDNLTTRTQDLMSEATAFFLRNLTLSMLRNPAVAGDYVEYELEIETDGDFKPTGNVNNSNLHSFSGTFAIRGFSIDDADMSTRLVSSVEDLLVTSPESPIVQILPTEEED